MCTARLPKATSFFIFATLLCASQTFSQATGTSVGIPLDLESEQSIRDAAATAAYGLMSWYTGNQTGGVPGNLPDPYYWWEAGAMMMTMVDYWYYTGDNSYNQEITEGILWQVGPREDFMTPNQTRSTGNDDQGFWGFAAMDAAELAFPNPPPDQPQWLALAQAVFNTQAPRWDTNTCNGGLRWQVFTFNAGYHYKNTISQGCFFNLGARLARYTDNQTYADWANRVWDWSERIGLITNDLHFYDGSGAETNCTDVNPMQWTYNAGVFLHGAAAMWNYTEDPIWRTRIDGILDSLQVFFPAEHGGNIMVEVACEGLGTCNQDQRSFKAYLSRWLAVTTQLAPWTHDRIMSWIRPSAIGAARQCSGGSADSAQPGYTCGLRWTNSTWDGWYGPGEQMAALAVIGANLIDSRPPPVTETRGGISQGNPNAGTGTSDLEALGLASKTITTADRAGAAILTILFGVLIIGGGIWMVYE